MFYSKQLLIDTVKAAAEDVFENAEDYVGEIDRLEELDIRILIGIDKLPEIQVSKIHSSNKILTVQCDIDGERKASLKEADR